MQRFQEASDWTLCSSGWEAQAEVQPEGHSLFWPFCPNLGIDTVASGAIIRSCRAKTLNTLSGSSDTNSYRALGWQRTEERKRPLHSYVHKLSARRSVRRLLGGVCQITYIEIVLQFKWSQQSDPAPQETSCLQYRACLRGHGKHRWEARGEAEVKRLW